MTGVETSDYLKIEPLHDTRLATVCEGARCVHVFDIRMIRAVNTALAARRPLLVRGEPGVGKSQLARAVAKELGRAFVSRVLDARTEPGDLFWWLDAVRRLADAQIKGEGQSELSMDKYIKPGPMWWAFDWGDAEGAAEKAGYKAPEQQDGGNPEKGVVVLLDEIDKADSSVPNALLEALGAGTFDSPLKRVTMKRRPLVMITTNEERELPGAFLRRCIVLHLELPEGEDELINWLSERGASHFPDMSREVLVEAARQLAVDRARVRKRRRAPPGQAEFLDLLRAVEEISHRREPAADQPTLEAVQLGLLEEIKRFVFDKHPASRR